MRVSVLVTGLICSGLLPLPNRAPALAQTPQEIVAGYKAQHSAFSDQVETCKPFAQSFDDPLSGKVLNREVLGPSEQGCRIIQDAYGPERLLCTIPASELAGFTAAWRAIADNINPDGSYRIQYSSSNPDPLTRFYNSEKCKQVKK